MPWKEINVMSQKIEFVLKSFSKEISFTALCKQYGISTKTGYKWKQRFLEDGITGLEDKPKIPNKNPRKLSEEVVCELIRIKKTKPEWGPKKVRLVYANNHAKERIPSRSTVERILKKAGFVETKKKRRRGNSERIQYRIKPEKANDVWTVDFKGWWYTAEREKCEPLTVRDEYSRYVLAISILEKGDISSVKREFERIFKEYGLPRVIRSDNGPPFASSMAIMGLTKLAVWWMSLGIKLDRIDPASPYQNGAHERFHLDIKKELEKKIDGSLKMHQQVFNVWRDEYNEERPHEGIDMKTPAMLYNKSERKYDVDVEYMEYPGGYLSRQVNDRGYINYKGHRIFISNAFAGYNVGLKKNGLNNFEVCFDDNHIGYIDLNCYLFESVLRNEKGKVSK
jgi:putative transposase